MAKKKSVLTPIPSRRDPRPAKKTAKPGLPEADLSHITESLRDKAFPLDQLAFMVNNPLKHPEEQIRELQASLRTFGQVEPIVVNKRPSPPVVIAGNGRMAAMLGANLTHAAVVFVDLSDEEANALALTLNYSREGAAWDKVAVEELMRTVQTSDQDLAGMFTRLEEDLGLIPEDKPQKPKDETSAVGVTTVTITCPSDRYGEIGMAIEHCKSVPGVTVKVSEKGKEESTANAA